MSRYDTEGAESRFQPGSNNLVLENFLGITEPAEMDDAELQLLLKLYEQVLPQIPVDSSITLSDIMEWHRQWLGNIYPWAGKPRNVEISKGGFLFASTAHFSKLFNDLELKHLAKLTPCNRMTRDELVQAIAELHVEFILIHPFREGNGRIARFLADVMAHQGGVGRLDYTAWNENKEDYIKCIHAGLDLNYAPMAQLVRQAAGL